jgi:hypothetical protein
VHRKRQEADIGTTPSRMLERGALVAAGRAPGTSTELIARCVGTPADHRHSAGDRRRVPALLAIEPEPRCGAVQITEGRGGASGLHATGLDARRAHRVQPLGVVGGAKRPTQLRRLHNRTPTALSVCRLVGPLLLPSIDPRGVSTIGSEQVCLPDLLLPRT